MKYMRCLTFIEFMTLNKSNNNLKDEKYTEFATLDQKIK